MKVKARSGQHSFEEFCLLVKEKQKADLIDGVIYMASPDNEEHDELYVWLIRLLGDYTELKDLGKVTGSRRAYKLDERNSPEPDIAFVRQDRLHLSQFGHFEGAPDLAIEIVSPDSAERDYDKKRSLYQRAKVPEYWIIDEELKKVTLLRFDAKDKYREVKVRRGELHSQVLAGFWLRVEWLWQPTRPRKTEALTTILKRLKA